MTAIVRAPRSGQFEIIPHALIRDFRLSYRAFGIAVRLLSNADGYKMTSADLARERGEGRDAIRTALRELETAGYLHRQRRQNERGRWSTEVTIFDTPATEDGFSGVGRPGTGKPIIGKPAAGESGTKSSSTKHQTNTITRKPLLRGADGDGLSQKEQQVVVVELAEGLILPPQLTAAQVAAAKQVLAKSECPAELMQDVLDELQGNIERGKVRETPLRLLRGLLQDAAAGTFVPDLGIQIKERRQREVAEAAKQTDQHEQTLDSVDAWTSCLEALRGDLSAGDLSTWIDPLQVVWRDNAILLLAPNAFVVERVRERHLPRIRELLKSHAGCSDVGLEVGSTRGKSSKREAA